MRARLGVLFAGLQVELREVTLKNKPAQMLAISPKGTVPVLRLVETRNNRTPINWQISYGSVWCYLMVDCP